VGASRAEIANGSDGFSSDTNIGRDSDPAGAVEEQATFQD
jgi:hypothetical protein